MGNMRNMNQSLCNFLKSIDSEKRDILLAMVEHLLDLSDIPGGLGALTTTLPMQLFFLKQLLLKRHLR